MMRLRASRNHVWQMAACVRVELHIQVTVCLAEGGENISAAFNLVSAQHRRLLSPSPHVFHSNLQDSLSMKSGESKRYLCQWQWVAMNWWFIYRLACGENGLNHRKRPICTTCKCRVTSVCLCNYCSIPSTSGQIALVALGTLLWIPLFLDMVV